MEKEEYPHVWVQDKHTREKRRISRKSYSLNQGKYILLKDGEKTKEEKEAAILAENEDLKRQLAELKAKNSAEESEELPQEESSVSRETEAVEQTEATEQTEESAVTRGPGRPKKNKE